MYKEKTINIHPSDNVLTILEGQAPKPFVYEGFKYVADSTDSLVALVRSKGSAESTVISYNTEGVFVVLDDTVTDRPKDRITYNFTKSVQFKEWASILTNGTTMDQKEFIKFLQRRKPGEITGIDKIIGTLQQFKFVTNIAGDFSFTDGNNYTFMVKVGDAEGTIKLPQTFDAYIEILNESGLNQFLEIELEFKKPTSEKEKPNFVLSCPKFQRYYNDAVKHEIKKLKKSLDGYLIVAGAI